VLTLVESFSLTSFYPYQKQSSMLHWTSKTALWFNLQAMEKSALEVSTCIPAKKVVAISAAMIWHFSMSYVMNVYVTT